MKNQEKEIKKLLMPKKRKKKKKVKKIIKKEKKEAVKKPLAQSNFKTNEEKIQIKKIKKQATEKRIYNIKDYVVYPKHGVGKITSIDKASEIVRNMVDEAENVLRNIGLVLQ